MANDDRIKVVGYAQRVFYDQGIEYRNFTDDLVGNQQTSNADGKNSVFTLGNFVTTVNYEGRASRIFSTKKFSDFYCLENLKLDDNRTRLLLNNNINTTINIDRTDLCSFAYFGSATEYVRVSLEKIITNWPASLYVNPIRLGVIELGETVSDYTYSINTNKGKFSVDTNFIQNQYEINYKKNGSILDTFNETNDLRNLTVNFANYVIFVNDTEYPVIGFTGSTTETDDTIYFEVLGNPFISSSGITVEYHIKPNKEICEEFFNSLNEFENNLLSRLTYPQYTSTYSFKIEAEDGTFVNTKKNVTWPTTDGYNIDFNTQDYANFINELLEVSNAKDFSQTNLMTRFLTSESISDFDTVPRCDGTEEETAGQKMNKTLKIYGREFDEIKKYMDGISYANVVSYDKKKNTPDQLVKYLARVLGWELTSSLLENDLINNYLKTGNRTYPGYSRGLTPNEAELELWRRLILNSAHIWKSKGTRNPIEFLFKFIGTPDGLVEFNEHVYVVKEPIDMDLFYKVLEYNNLSTDLNDYNVDADGYPKFFRNTFDMWYQKGGGWYRETAGSAATQYTLMGNNPHVGPYDGGYEYIAQLENIIPNFTAFTLTSTTVTTGTTNLFTNYNNGLVNQYSGPTYVEPQALDGTDLSGVILLETRVIDDACPQAEKTDCGCDVPEDDQSLIIDVERLERNSESTNLDCKDGVSSSRFDDYRGHYTWNYPLNGINGKEQGTYPSFFISPICCSTLTNGYSYYHQEYILSGGAQGRRDRDFLAKNDYNTYISSNVPLDLFDSGYICCPSPGVTQDIGKKGCGCTLSCKWEMTGPTVNDCYYLNNRYYLQFIDGAGNPRVVNEADSCFCPVETGLVSAEVIKDPYTGKQGYACQLNKRGLDYFYSYNTKDSNFFYALYKNRKWGLEQCREFNTTIKVTPNIKEFLGYGKA